MKVFQVLDNYYPKFDGPVQVITNYCKCMNKIDGVEAEVLVPRFPNYEDNQPFHVFRVKSMKGPDGDRTPLPKFDRKLKKYLKENKPDIIHIHSPFTMCGFFTKYGKKHNIPTIFTFHTKFKEDYERVLKWKPLVSIAMKYMMHNINKADYVVTVSNGAADCLREYGYKKHIDVIRNGTDLSYSQKAETLQEEVSKKFNLQKDEIIFLSVGRIVENKKLSFALKVMKKLKDMGFSKFKYLIVGAGSYENALKQQTTDLGLEKEVLFTGKIMDREFLSAIYLRADLFIFPSTFDTASLAPIEAAAMKLPTIMNNGCSTAEIITDKQNGLLPNENVDDWAKTILEAIQKGQLKALREPAYKEVYRTWDSVSKEILEYYDKVIKNAKDSKKKK